MDVPLDIPEVAPLPAWTSAELWQRTALFLFARLQFPRLVLADDLLLTHLERTFQLYQAKQKVALSWQAYLEGLYVLDWYVCVGCLERLEVAWEILFAARTGRTDCLLVDALRFRAARLYPTDLAAQEQAVSEFWSRLLVPDRPAALPILARYDGRRPLVPWLIRVFQNEHISRLRQASDSPLEEDDHFVPADVRPKDSSESHWRELFVQAAQEWLSQLSEEDLLLLGLRWRYRLNQREAARLFGLNEGTLTRRTDKLRDRALSYFRQRLEAEGWTGEDLTPFIFSELGQVLTDDPRLSADHLAYLLARRQSKQAAS